jgi:hypothetical protein
MSIHTVKYANAIAGEAIVYSGPATTLAATFPTACPVASSPKRRAAQLISGERGHRGVLGGLRIADAHADHRESNTSNTIIDPEIANRP